MSAHILISGASIAGPALAHWLHQFGFQATVVERWPGLRPGGQAVDVRGVAKEVLRRMGLDERVRAACTDTDSATIVTRRNRRVATLRSDQFDGDGLVAEIEILRGDFAEVLYTATKGHTEYVFGDRIAKLTEEAHGVAVRFASGAERRFDLVVGADGLHSGVRALAFGPESEYVRHLGHYLAFFTVPNRLGLHRQMLGYLEPGRTAGLRSVRDERYATAYFSFHSPPLDYDFRDVEAQQAIPRERLAGMAWETPWLLEQLDDAPDFYFDACAQVELDRWWSGRVALLGDAAFCPSPMSGQGTSLALVGAYVLAGELAAAGGDHTVAFPTYQARLREFVAANQKIGRDNATSRATTSRRSVALYYARFAAMAYLPGMGSIMRRVMRALNDLELPDYGAAPVPR